MVGHRLKNRLDALERPKAGLGAVTKLHWLLRNEGETTEAARARYEAEWGPLGPSEGFIVWKPAVMPCPV